MSSQTHPIPYQDRVIISRNKPETVSAGGIIIPEAAIEEENKGLVIAVGPNVGKGLTTDKFPQPGDYVLFGEYAGTKIEHNGTSFLIMRESDIMCKI